jgi:hypothetical protein
LKGRREAVFLFAPIMLLRMSPLMAKADVLRFVNHVAMTQMR